MVVSMKDGVYGAST